MIMRINEFSHEEIEALRNLTPDIDFTYTFANALSTSLVPSIVGLIENNDSSLLNNCVYSVRLSEHSANSNLWRILKEEGTDLFFIGGYNNDWELYNVGDFNSLCNTLINLFS